MRLGDGVHDGQAQAEPLAPAHPYWPRPGRHAAGEPAEIARRDFAVGLALAASWCAVWGLYATYTWTTQPHLTTLAASRFYVPALGAMALLGAWLVARLPRRAPIAAAACVVVAAFGLGVWSFHAMLNRPLSGPPSAAHTVRR